MTFENLDKTIRQMMRKKKTPGLALSVWQNNVQIYSKGFGSRSLKPSLPMTSDTLMGIGSITKSFTAFAIQANIREESIAYIVDAEGFSSFKPDDAKGCSSCLH